MSGFCKTLRELRCYHLRNIKLKEDGETLHSAVLYVDDIRLGMCRSDGEGGDIKMYVPESYRTTFEELCGKFIYKVDLPSGEYKTRLSSEVYLTELVRQFVILQEDKERLVDRRDGTHNVVFFKRRLKKLRRFITEGPMPRKKSERRLLEQKFRNKYKNGLKDYICLNTCGSPGDWIGYLRSVERLPPYTLELIYHPKPLNE